MQRRRQLLKVARHLSAVYDQRFVLTERDQQSEWRALEAKLEHLQRCRRLVEKAKAHGWLLAAHGHESLLPSALRSYCDAARAFHRRWFEHASQTIHLRDLLAEVTALYEEFDWVIVDLKKKCLAVDTDPIVLDEKELGRFRIQLRWPRLAVRASVGCFEVIALDPRPAEGDSEVTHPHVRHGQLCAGDATVPLTKALEQGRLVDAFVLLRSVLTTYNDASAYVTLDNWGGLPCWDCGVTMTEDDRSYCDGCNRDTCDDCMAMCRHCDRYRCMSCLSRCDDCRESCCAHCLTTPDSSTLSICPDCMDPATRRHSANAPAAPTLSPNDCPSKPTRH